MKKRILLMGPHACEKSLLAAHLDDKADQKFPKKGSIFYTDECICVPTSYLESPWMHCYIIALQQQADLIVMMQTVGSTRNLYPPNFAKVFTKKVIGVLSWQSQNDIPHNWQQAEKILHQTLIQEPFLSMNMEEYQSVQAIAKQIQKERRKINGEI